MANYCRAVTKSLRGTLPYLRYLLNLLKTPGTGHVLADAGERKEKLLENWTIQSIA
jgi:hypothetical protein